MPKSPPQKPDAPAARIGVYKRLAEVPDRYRLAQYADEYAGRDVWAEFMEYERETHGYDSARYCENSERCTRYWESHMVDRGRHPALATPADVEVFVVGLLERMKPESAYLSYWTRLEGFYDYLQSQTEHPHRYHPVVMAAVESDSAARRVWDAKLERNNRRDES